MKKLDLTDMRFGMLQVMASADAYVSPKGYRLSQWICECDCGATTVVPTTHLTSGHTLSCGCQKLVNLKPRQIKDIVGMKFGMLTVMNRQANRMSGNNSRVVWRCCCDCGNMTDVLGILLTTGYVKSCGCVHQSHAELLFKEWLEQCDFNFIEQYGFKDLLGENGKPLLFDFAVQNKNNGGWILVELDGIQHFQPISWFGGQEKFERVVRNDKRKNDWCRTMNIPLIRINVSSCRSDLSFVREYQEGLKDLGGLELTNSLIFRRKPERGSEQPGYGVAPVFERMCQTVIEPTIDMWTRELRPNNMVINDPKGELLQKFYVPGTYRGFQIVQFNLINAMNTDIYNRAKRTLCFCKVG